MRARERRHGFDDLLRAAQVSGFALRAGGVAAVAAGVAAAVLAVALAGGGSGDGAQVVPGLDEAGRLTGWGLPVVRLVLDGLAVLTVGAVLAAAVLVPLDGGRLAPAAARHLRAAAWLSSGWALAAAATLALTLSDVLGEPLGRVLTTGSALQQIRDLPQGTALALVVVLTLALAVLTWTRRTPGGALGALALAGVALLPPPLTGHSAAATNHGAAVTSLAMHVVGVAFWVGGLAVLVAHAARRGPRIEVMCERFGRMAPWCFVAVGLSGIANLATRTPSVADLVTGDYGRLAIAKGVAFAVLGWFGWWHRRRTLPAVAAGSVYGFARLAAVETVVMAAAMGLAVALSRTAPSEAAVEEGAVQALLGQAPLAEPTLGRLVTLWRFDLFFAVLVVVLAGLYAAGVARSRSWPGARVLSWYAGLLVVVVATQSGVARYAFEETGALVVQQALLAGLASYLLVAGAPVRLVLDVVRPARIDGDRGPHEWLLLLVRTRGAGRAVGAGLLITVSLLLYVTPLGDALRQGELRHLAVNLAFLAGGVLLFQKRVSAAAGGSDRPRNRVPAAGSVSPRR
ncbi:cytochrome c oxidase assembly protein [Actinomadura sp. SCN-SB]|uniref:cytochrome c oxidase assembly protein n=1 Tax=Actinomadura sp. SCN-SB TaxID=3373092 RepID=UPI0037531E1B